MSCCFGVLSAGYHFEYLLYPHFAYNFCSAYQKVKTASTPKNYITPHATRKADTIYTAFIRKHKASNGREQFDSEGEYSDLVGKVENLANDALHLSRRAIGRWGCTSISSPYCFACGGYHQPRLQPEVLRLSVGERLLSQAEVHVGLVE